MQTVAVSWYSTVYIQEEQCAVLCINWLIQTQENSLRNVWREAVCEICGTSRARPLPRGTYDGILPCGIKKHMRKLFLHMISTKNTYSNTYSKTYTYYV